MEITTSDRQTIRTVFRDGFASGFHFAVSSVGDDGSPHVRRPSSCRCWGGARVLEKEAR